jgi:hypothetical protein
MAHARTHPQARQRSLRDLAYPLRRRTRWRHRRAVGRGEGSGALGVALRLLPRSNPGEQRFGTAATFEAARAALEAAWRDYLTKRSEADFKEWRQDAAWHTAKYARWDCSLRS